MNTKVVTTKMERVGSVYDIFGPEGSPYVSVRLDKRMPVSKAKALINDRLYTA